MQIILREEVEKLGRIGDVVKVADGYGRNYLIPRGMAVPATEANKKMVEQQKQAFLRRAAKEKSEMEQLGQMLQTVTLTFRAKAGENDQLFGSVTSQDIAEALEKQNYTLDRRKIQLEHPLKTLGDHKVPVRLHRDVTVDVTVTISRDE